MNRARALRMIWVVAVAAACSAARFGPEQGPAPGVTLPARYADTEQPDAAAGGKGAAGASGRGPDGGPPRTGCLPDPKPLQVARQWEYEIGYERGTVRVVQVTERRFAQPRVTARRMGRYAIELWIGHELVDRVRFDFPLLAAETVREGRRRPLEEPPSFAPGAVVTRTVLVPASERATRAVVVDRATGWTRELPWPPDAPLPPAVAAAAAPVAPPGRPPHDGGAAAREAGPADAGPPDAAASRY